MVMAGWWTRPTSQSIVTTLFLLPWVKSGARLRRERAPARFSERNVRVRGLQRRDVRERAAAAPLRVLHHHHYGQALQALEVEVHALGVVERAPAPGVEQRPQRAVGVQ